MRPFLPTLAVFGILFLAITGAGFSTARPVRSTPPLRSLDFTSIFGPELQMNQEMCIDMEYMFSALDQMSHANGHPEQAVFLAETYANHRLRLFSLMTADARKRGLTQASYIYPDSLLRPPLTSFSFSYPQFRHALAYTSR